MDFKHMYKFPEEYVFPREVWHEYFEFAIDIHRIINDARLTRRQKRKFKND